MNSAVLLATQNQRLYEQNQRQKRKRSIQRTYIQQGGVLQAQQAQDPQERNDNIRTETAEDNQHGDRSRTPPRCSACRSLEHNARRCPELQPIR